MTNLKTIALLAAPLLIWGLTSSFDRDKRGAPPVPPPPPPPPPPGPTPVSGPTRPPMTITPTNAELLGSIDEQWSQARERQIMGLVLAGKHDPIDFTFITSQGRRGSPLENYTLVFPVMDDAIKIGGVRVEGTFETNQRLADWLGLTVFTPYAAALLSEQADGKIAPTTLSPTTATKSQMIQASGLVDKKLEAFPDAKLARNVGKYWVLTSRYLEPGAHPTSGVKKLDAGANHGLFKSSFDPIQNVGTFHPWNNHTDYSQMLRYIGPKAWLVTPDGVKREIDTKSIVTDDTIAPLLTGEKNRIYNKQVGEGVLAYDRHPSIPETARPVVVV